MLILYSLGAGLGLFGCLVCRLGWVKYYRPGGFLAYDICWQVMTESCVLYVDNDEISFPNQSVPNARCSGIL